VIRWFFFFWHFLCQIIQREFPCRQTARPTPNYTFLFLFFFKFPPMPPTRSTQTHFSLPTPVLLCPSTLLSLFKAPIYFHFYHFIHSPNDNINECITFWKRDEGSKKERWIYTVSLLPSLSLSLSLHISDVGLCLAWSSRAYGNGAVADGRESHRQSRWLMNNEQWRGNCSVV